MSALSLLAIVSMALGQVVDGARCDWSRERPKAVLAPSRPFAHYKSGCGEGLHMNREDTQVTMPAAVCVNIMCAGCWRASTSDTRVCERGSGRERLCEPGVATSDA